MITGNEVIVDGAVACVYQAVVELTEIKAGELVVVTGPARSA